MIVCRKRGFRTHDVDMRCQRQRKRLYGFDYFCMVSQWDGPFYDDETRQVRRAMNTQEIHALSTSHLQLTVTGFTLAQMIWTRSNLNTRTLFCHLCRIIISH